MKLTRIALRQIAGVILLVAIGIYLLMNPISSRPSRNDSPAPAPASVPPKLLEPNASWNVPDTPSLPPAVQPEKPLPVPPPAWPAALGDPVTFEALYKQILKPLNGHQEEPAAPEIPGENEKTRIMRKWITDPALGNLVREAVLIAGHPDRYLARQLWSSRSLAFTRQELEWAGRPMTMAQLIPPKPAGAENAAPVYLAALAKLKERQVDGQSAMDWISRGFRVLATPEELAGLQKTLQDPVVIKAIGEIEAATLKPCQFDLDYSKGAAMPLPHLQSMRSLEWVFGAKAKMQAAAGDTAGAWDTAISGVRLADALKTEPILISQLVRIAVASIAMETVQQLAKKSLPTQAQARVLDEVLKGFDNIGPMIATTDGERLLFGESLFKFSANTGMGMSWPTIITLRGNPLFKRDYAAYLDFMRRYAVLAEQPYNPEALAALDRSVEQIPDYCILTKTMFPALSRVQMKYTWFRAQAAITRNGLAVLACKLAKGVYPKSLEEAGLKETMDPFTQKPLFYKPTAKGFLLYSAGENQKDDGGNGVRGEGGRIPDIVWDYKTP
jgi:hypothetical protein